ncbi:hypothetical protein Pelo_14593 [Pelomyxa schiedti]|nr:hypothetical protein Pelo_14592 [Pelomyxa schiedti]KAH3744003.1 hypothetical protein Pelo_14593 [Pelomyxa schiedti]
MAATTSVTDVKIELSALHIEFCKGSAAHNFILRVTDHSTRSFWQSQIDSEGASALTKGCILDTKHFEKYLQDNCEE